MIPRVEVLLDSVTEQDLTYFTPEQSMMVRDLMMCPHNGPIKDFHKFLVQSLILAPEHVKWLKEDLEDWVVLQHTPEGFVYWFANEQDAICFQLAFG